MHGEVLVKCTIGRGGSIISPSVRGGPLYEAEIIILFCCIGSVEYWKAKSEECLRGMTFHGRNGVGGILSDGTYCTDCGSYVDGCCLNEKPFHEVMHARI